MGSDSSDQTGEAILIGALLSMPWPCLGDLGGSCHVLYAPQLWNAVAALGFFFNSGYHLLFNTWYHLGCLNETFLFCIHKNFGTFPSFLFIYFLHHLKPFWTLFLLVGKIPGE